MMPTDTYSNFIQKIMEVIDKVAPIKDQRIKRNSQESFDSEISENLTMRDKLFKKEIYKTAQCNVENVITIFC